MSNSRENSDNQSSLFNNGFPGCMDMDESVRRILADAIKTCSKSREQIAEQMSYRVGREITVAMLDAFTAESKRQHRFPMAWVNAFCFVTGDSRLLACIVERAGFALVTPSEAAVARKFLDREIAERELRAATEVAIAERLKR